MNPPKKPDWRWLTYHGLLGRDIDGVDEEVLVYAKHLTKTHDDRMDAFEEIGLVPLLKWEKYDDNDEIDRAVAIREEPPIRRILEEMLLEQCDLELIQDALYHKFKETIAIEALEWYRDLFWDTNHLNAYEFGKYFAATDAERPDPPPISGKWRPHYRIFQQGGEVNINMSEAMERMFQRAFFRSEELARFGAAADDKVLQFQKNATKIFKALEKKETDGSVDLPEEFDKPIEYPSETAVGSDMLDGYDPHENPNEVDNE